MSFWPRAMPPGYFQKWADDHALPITALDDGTNETRLGAAYDIQFAIDKLKLDDDLLIIARDNVPDFSLTHFIRYAREKNTSCVMRYYEADAIADGCGTDAPGSLLAWMCQHSMEMPGSRYDIGNLESI